MKLLKTTVINQPIAKVWQVVGEDFINGGVWMSGVAHSEGTETGRVCTLDSKPNGTKAIENITHFDADNHEIGFEVIPKVMSGPGLPVVKNNVKIVLESQGNKTKVYWHSNVELKLIGRLLYPMLRFGFGKFFTDILDDLKVYVETGQPSQRKLKFDQKVQLAAA